MTQIFAIPLTALKAIANLLFDSDCAEEFMRAQKVKAMQIHHLGR